MMNVLDALRYRLGGMDTEGEPLDPAVRDMIRGSHLPPGFQELRQSLPQGLPLVVQDSIRNQPAYQEGGQFMAPPWSNPNVGEPVLLRDDPGRRDHRLDNLLGFNEYMRRSGQYAWPEGSFATPLKPGQSPFATPRLPSALNQLMRRLPYGQY